MTNKIKYLDVYNRIRSDILHQVYPLGTFLPPEGELCRLYDVGRSTLRRAVAMLAADNILSVKQGRGTEVISAVSDLSPTMPAKVRPSLYSLEFLVEGEAVRTQSPVVTDSIPAPEAAARALGVAVGSPIFRIQRIQYVNGLCYAYIVTYTNPQLTPGLDRLELPPNVNGFLIQRFGLQHNDCVGHLEIAAAGLMESQFFNVSLGAPLFLHRIQGQLGEAVYYYTERLYSPQLVRYNMQHFPDERYDAIT